MWLNMWLNVWISSLAFNALLAVPAFSQFRPPIPDRLGDYYSNYAPVQGIAKAPLQAGSLWQVVAPNLNCRRQAGQSFAVVRHFQRGQVLQAEVYRGGSDEVLLNALDSYGKPWMSVRGKNLSDTCYVRANRLYIRPLRESECKNNCKVEKTVEKTSLR